MDSEKKEFYLNKIKDRLSEHKLNHPMFNSGRLYQYIAEKYKTVNSLRWASSANIVQMNKNRRFAQSNSRCYGQAD